MVAGQPIIRTLPRAKVDIIAVWASLAEDSAAQADVFLDVLEKKLRLLAEVPAIGQERPDLAPKLRSFPFGGYRIFFRPVDRGIEAVRLLHEACDPTSPFPSDLS
jgi:toxin ParE1/3/4